jgi:hypothetical protein
MAEMDFELVRFVDVDGLRIIYMRREECRKSPYYSPVPWPESLFAFRSIWPLVAERGEVIAGRSARIRAI